MRPVFENVSALNGSPTLSIPTLSFVALNSEAFELCDRGVDRLLALGRVELLARGAAKTRLSTPPCSDANSDLIRSVAFCDSEPGIVNSSLRLPPTVATMTMSRTMRPIQPKTMRQGCVAQNRVQRASPPVDRRSWAKRRSGSISV